MARTIRLARFAAECFLKFVEVATARHPLPGHLPRQTRRYDPKDSACPDCACTGVPKIPAWLLLLQTKRISPMTNRR